MKRVEEATDFFAGLAPRPRPLPRPLPLGRPGVPFAGDTGFRDTTFCGEWGPGEGEDDDKRRYLLDGGGVWEDGDWA